MKKLLIKLDNKVFQEIEELLEKIKKPRNRYINEALQYYNRIRKKKMMAELLEKESKIVRKESLKVLAEFESLNECER